jgi:hypothetical protein
MSALVSEIITAAQEIVGEVTGAGTQVYGEDRMKGDVVRSFNLLFKKYPWPQYCKWFLNLELDGTLGVIDTADLFLDVIDFEDFISINYNMSSSKVLRLPAGMNPNTLTGTQLRGWSGLHVTDDNYDGKKLQFWPKASTSLIDVQARVYPISENEAGARVWADDDMMHFDKDMLAFGTAFFTLSNDGLNNGAADNCRQMMEMKFQDITSGMASQPIPLSPGDSGIPQDWFANP